MQRKISLRRITRMAADYRNGNGGIFAADYNGDE
jgi:hypothetical protein